MNYQWGASHCREKRAARVEVKTASDHNEEEQKQADHQGGLFNFGDHDAPPNH
jgi:hypothetical protein